jgi:hypothetical protein
MTPPVPPPPPIEPDPFKNARGLAGMFGSRRGGGPPLWPFLLIAIGVIAVIAVRIQLAGEAKRQRELDMQLNQTLQNEFAFGRSPFGSTGAQVSPDVYRSPGAYGQGAVPSREELTVRVRKTCKKLGTCGETKVDEQTVEGCVSQQMVVATDGESRAALGMLLDDIDAKCGTLECEPFARCYFERLSVLSGGTIQAPAVLSGLPKAPGSAEPGPPSSAAPSSPGSSALPR